MSLNVYLNGPKREETCYCTSCGNEHNTTVSDELFWANITHNLVGMADAAGIYKHLWRPEEIGITKASQLIQPLSAGLDEMKSNPEKYKAYNAKNGWGTYEDFIPWIEEYLKACTTYPEAEIRVSR